MQESPERNYELEDPSIFNALNQYYLLFFALICLFSSVFLQQLFTTLGQSRLGICVAPVLGIILPVFLLTRRFPTGFRKQLRIRAPELRMTSYVLVATLSMIVVIDHLYLISQQFLPGPVDYVESLKELKPKGILSAIVTFLGLCVVVPIAEEIVFRGMVQQVFTHNMGEVLALVLAGVFFGVIHLNPQLLLSMACLGVFVGFIFYATSNLTYAMFSHGVVNTVAFFQLTFATDESFETAPFYLESRWMLLVGIAIVLTLLRQIKKEAPVAGGSL